MKGEISVQTQHIFPVIKKWLYSEKDIFLREIVSNASDAVTKHKRLIALSKIEPDGTTYRIDVKLDKKAKTITVSDNGIGMSEEELDKYINKIALSGAVDFIEKHEGDKTGSGIIGHFGLGFYSSFMVAAKVEIITKSYDGSPAIRWICDEEGSFETSTAERAYHGSDIIMHVNDSEKEYLDAERLQGILDKYCAFMPVEIYFDEVGKKKKKDSDKDVAEDDVEKPVNDTSPLWLRQSADIKPDEYNDFYRKVFYDYRDPLFYIHINADYPLNFKGILYFPKQKNEMEPVENQVKLFYNQVFVADNIKEIIPDFLLNIKGVLDCPELPLNVSRSYLQTNTYVAKVSAHIAKKVSDKISGMFNTDREGYEKIWNDIAPFVEYACLRDKKYYDRVKNAILFKTVDGKLVTLDEYTEGKKEATVYYTNAPELQSYYVNLLKKQNKTVLLLDRFIDSQFLTFLEQENPKLKFARVDASLDAVGGESEENEKLTKLFKEVIGKEDITIKTVKLKDSTVPALIEIDEQSRRFSEMMRAYAAGGVGDGIPDMPEKSTVVVNLESPIIKRIEASDDKDKSKKLVKQAYMMALLSSRQLTADEMTEFIETTVELLG
ncbi:MAG: molecular chaperone HtpG [Eubacteriales bacterium]|nr:molecular chaperone HtpG [Eubacteriales bacterium]MDD4474549.1 molecular chaperone HtpG [Eubacteriales bacterium]